MTLVIVDRWVPAAGAYLRVTGVGPDLLVEAWVGRKQPLGEPAVDRGPRGATDLADRIRSAVERIRARQTAGAT